MPRVGSSSMRTSGSANIHLESRTFCWFPPERLPTLCCTEGVLVSSFSEILRHRVFLVNVDDAHPGADFFYACHGVVYGDGVHENKAVVLAVLGDIGEARFNSGALVFRLTALPCIFSVPVTSVP